MVPCVFVFRGKAVKCVHTPSGATELRETTKNTQVLGKALVSGYHQLQTWNLSYMREIFGGLPVPFPLDLYVDYLILTN